MCSEMLHSLSESPSLNSSKSESSSPLARPGYIPINKKSPSPFWIVY